MPDTLTELPQTYTELPLILAGPMVRRVTSDSFVLWLVSSCELRLRLALKCGEEILLDQVLTFPELRVLALGERAFVHCIAVCPAAGLPLEHEISYELAVCQDGQWRSLFELLPELRYGTQPARIRVPETIRELWHGSCRKPHHPSPDALVAADQLLQARSASGEAPPDFLLMTGDQVYLDDLCGPMLLAIHQVIERLGLPNESFPAATLADAHSLYQAPDTLYGRRNYLPRLLAENRYSRLFTAAAKPVFTSGYCDNHLISFAEAFVLYLLSWSPTLWTCVRLPSGSELALSPEKQQLYDQEKAALEAFVAGLPRVQRLLAQLPSYMIFDDHDVTDDWNLTAGWEQAAYGHAFSRRIIGNALMAYWLCQGWGNDPQAFDQSFWDQAEAFCRQPGPASQEAWIATLLDFEGWGYSLQTSPKLVVLDTRTRRWHSESDPNQPSGLMDWEALSEMQQALVHQPAVILVSPAPMFGVKLVEVLQKTLTLMGKALAVDAENWMAHAGAANSLLNIFKHGRSPRHIVILSGDVHYSFVYDIAIRFRRNSPKIWQITTSGLKNEFPRRMLQRLGKLNRVLYHRRSPLNWLTRRKRMKIEPRRAEGKAGWQLVNASAIGMVRFNPAGAPCEIALLTGDGKTLRFEPDSDSPIGPVSASDKPVGAGPEPKSSRSDLWQAEPEI